MDPKKLYETQLKIFAVDGFLLNYKNNWRGYLTIVYGLYSFLTSGLVCFFFICNLIFASNPMTDFAQLLATTISTSETVNKILMFYLSRKKVKKLIGKMTSLIESGDSLDVRSFNRVANIGKTLTNVYNFSAHFTSVSYLLRALYKTVFWKRTIPFVGK